MTQATAQPAGPELAKTGPMGVGGASTAPAATGQPQHSAPADAGDDAYSKAFKDMMAKDNGTATPAVTPSADIPSPTINGQPPASKPASEQGGQQQATAPASGQPTPGKLSDEDKALLSRQKMTVERFQAAFPSETEQREWLDHTAKRERDQQTEFNRLKAFEQQAGKQTNQPGQGQQQAGQQQQGQEQQAGKPPTAAPELRKQVETVVAQLDSDFGSEMAEPLGGLFNQTLDLVDGLTAQNRQMQDILAGKVITDAIRDLAAEFPSVTKPEARQKVQDRFHQIWQATPAAAGQSFLDRVGQIARDAALAEFGQTTEAAAQVALANNRNQERLGNQPFVGSHSPGAQPPGPANEDASYHDAFEKHLKRA